MGRKPKNAVSEEAPAKKTAAKTKKRDNETLASLAEIEAKLLKKAKTNGNVLEQGEIYDALNNYELEDDVIDDLIEYFAKQKIEVVSDDDEDEDEDLDEDIGDLSEEEMLSEPDDTDDFYSENAEESEEENASLIKNIIRLIKK